MALQNCSNEEFQTMTKRRAVICQTERTQELRTTFPPRTDRKSVAVKKVKEFEEHFLTEMENKLPEVMAEFKKGNLPEEGLKKMTELANGIMPQYK